VQEVNDHK
jgi:Ataxin-3